MAQKQILKKKITVWQPIFLYSEIQDLNRKERLNNLQSNKLFKCVH